MQEEFKRDSGVPSETPTAGATPDNELAFSQSDVNRIVSERLGKERTKLTGELSAREEELARREYQYQAREALYKRGYVGEDGSLEILSVINANTVDELNKALDIIDKYTSLGHSELDRRVKDEMNKRLMQASPSTRPPQPGSDVRKAFGIKT